MGQLDSDFIIEASNWHKLFTGFVMALYVYCIVGILKGLIFLVNMISKKNTFENLALAC